jgi:hypothetical protein
LVQRLAAISNELMAKVVEIDTTRDKSGKPGETPALAPRLCVWKPKARQSRRAF